MSCALPKLQTVLTPRVPAGAAQVAALAAAPGGDAAASSFLALVLGGLLDDEAAQRSADEAVRAALGPDAPARLAAAAAPVA